MIKSILFLIAFLIFWQPLKSQHDWVHLDGPEGSPIVYLYSNSSFLFAPENDFLYRTNDGVNWEKIDHEVGSLWGINEVIIVNLFRDDAGTMKIRNSQDNGESWVEKSVHPNITYHGGIAIATHGIYISQGNYSLLFKSEDFGDTWESILPPFMYGHDLYSFDNKIFLSGGSNLWHTDENGNNWKDISPPAQDVNDHIKNVEVFGEYIFITGEEHVFYSYDFGDTWNVVEIEWSNSAYKLAVAGNNIYVHSKHLYRSIDLGNSWEIISEYGNHPHLLTMTDFNGQFFGASYNNGVFSWDENQHQLIEKNDGLSKGAIYDLSINNNKIWTACGQGVFFYDIPTDTWSSKMELPRPSFQYQSIGAGNNGWVVTKEDYKSYFYLSMDEGLSWDTIAPSNNGSNIYFENIEILGNKLYLFEEGFAWVSQDSGKSWGIADIYAIGNKFVEFKDEHLALGNNRIYRSIDMGENWAEQNIILPLIEIYSSQNYLYALSIDPNDPSLILDLHYSTDGINWEQSTDGLPELDYFDLMSEIRIHFFQDKNNHYVLWGNEGLYVSSDTLKSWELLVPDIHGRAYLTHDSTVYLGNNGLYKSEISSPNVTSVINKNNYEKIKIYPNPIKSNFSIEINSGLQGDGILHIYHVNGELISTKIIHDISQPILMTLDDLPDGVYLVRLDTEKGIHVNKLIIQN